MIWIDLCGLNILKFTIPVILRSLCSFQMVTGRILPKGFSIHILLYLIPENKVVQKWPFTHLILVFFFLAEVDHTKRSHEMKKSR